MKKNKISVFIILLFLLKIDSFSQIELPAEDHFIFSTGNLSELDSYWTKIGDPFRDIQIVSGNLTYPSYSSSSTGNQIQLSTGSATIDYILFNPISSGNTVYASFLLTINNLLDVTTDGSFFAGFDKSGMSVFEEGAGRIWIRKPIGDPTNTLFNLGVTKNSNAGVYRQWTSDYTLGITYLVVAGYSVVPGDNNDVVKLWVNPDLTGMEPLPTIEIGIGSPFIDKTPIENFFFKQTGEAVNANIDEIRIATNWSQAPLPVELISFSATNIGSLVRLNWKTSSEINNFGFDVERSVIKDNWKKIAFINGYGHSNSPKYYTFEDKDINEGQYSYRLKQIDNDGQFEYSNIITISFNTQTKFELDQNYPNPFNPSTTIRYDIPNDGIVRIKLYSILGDEIMELLNEFKVSGTHTYILNAGNLPSGTYFYRIIYDNVMEIKKMILLK